MALSKADREEIAGLVRAEIDAALTGMPAWERHLYDRRLAAKRAQLVADRAQLVAATPSERAKSIKSMTPGRRSELFSEMALGDQVSVARGLPRDALELLLEVIVDRDHVEVAVSPAVPFVSVTTKPGARARTAPVPSSKYPGWSLTNHAGESIQFVEPLESWILRLAIDKELKALIDEGEVIVTQLEPEAARAATLRAWHGAGKRVPALPTARV